MKLEFLREFCDRYRDYRLEAAGMILLPFWRCKIEVCAEINGGIDPLSRILLSLIRAGESDLAALAKFLGVETDSFVFSHLHYLTTHGYIAEREGEKFFLTAQGEGFLSGARERRFESEPFRFWWSDLENAPTEEPDKYNNGKSPRILHGEKPAHAKLEAELPRLFDKERRKESVVFYDADFLTLKSEKKFVKFLGLLYIDKEDENQIGVDIRRADSGHELEEALRDAINHDRFDRFDKIQDAIKKADAESKN